MVNTGYNKWRPPFKLKRSSVPGKRPELSDLHLGELAINFYDGHLYAERDTKGVGIGTTVANITPWQEKFNSTDISYIGNVGVGTDNITAKLDETGTTKTQQLNVSGVSTFAGLVDINAGIQADTFKVEDLTDNRVVIAGSGGELEDDANLTFNGTQLAVGVNLNVSGVSDYCWRSC